MSAGPPFEEERAAEPPAEPGPVLPQGPPRVCWRCGKANTPELAACAYCFAPLGSGAARTVLSTRQAPQLVSLIVIFSLLLLTSLIWGVSRQLGANESTPRRDEDLLFVMLAIEVIDTVLVLVAIAWAGLPQWPRTEPIRPRRLAAWIAALPLLAVLFGVNWGYHYVLVRFIDFPFDFDERWPLSPLTFVVVCVQPAIVEELFFRYLMLGHLRSLMGPHAAILLSSVMFGVAHIGVPLSIPILTVIGLGLGYLRVWGGGLVLPMLLHFGHNLAVVCLDGFA